MSLKAKLIVYGTAGLVALVWLWTLRHKHDTKVDTNITSTVLPSSDTEKLIVDPRQHTIEVISRSLDGRTKVTKKYLNRRGATSIEEKKDGLITITQRTFGTEFIPYVGLGLGSDVRLRAAFGTDIFYIHGFDVGAGLLVSQSLKDTRGMVHVAYNVYDNVNLGVYVDHKAAVGMLATLSF